MSAKRSSTDAQEKDLKLDKDMDKDTWNFKSMEDNDPMDFGVELPADKKKKNAFELDIGFDLDGDFGNFSSFKMDMPDFDFSSPAKKTTKTKESSDDKSSGNLKKKKNPFAFEYDFDARLDDFDLDSSPPKKGSETEINTMDSEKFPASRKTDKSDSLDFGSDLAITRKAAPMVSTGDAKEKGSAENENQILKTTETMAVDSSTHSKQATLESLDNSDELESSPLRIKTSHTMCLQRQPVNTSPLKSLCPMVEEIDEPSPSKENTAPSPLHDSETPHTALNRETSPDIHETYRSGTKKDSSRDPEQNAKNKMISVMESNHENTDPNISSWLCLDKIEHQQEEMGTDTQVKIQDHTKRKVCDPDARDSQATLSEKISSGTCLSQTSQVQDSSAMLPLVPSHSVPGLNDLKAMRNKDSGVIRSKFFKKPEKPQPHVLESSAIQTEIQPVIQERIGGLNMNLKNDKRNEIKDASPGSKTRTCPIELVKTVSKTANVNPSSDSHEKTIDKDPPNAKAAENVTGLMDHLELQAKSTSRERSILHSSKVDASSLTQKLSKHLSSLQKSKIVSLERPKLGNIMSDLRSTKTLRTTGENKDQSKCAAQPEVTSSTSKERNIEAGVPREKTQILHCPSSLKRKALDEEADRSMKPQFKRFSMSPRENRNLKELTLTHRVAEKKFSVQESRIYINNNNNNTTKEENPETKSHHQITNLEIPITENAANIEKAEAYTKELDNICNILKKKHEEAKELLVRSVVNNNKLLMLNHPLHEDKIRMVQKLAEKLTLRDQ